MELFCDVIAHCPLELQNNPSGTAMHTIIIEPEPLPHVKPSKAGDVCQPFLIKWIWFKGSRFVGQGLAPFTYQL
jgi:hypothetical protein